MNKKLAILPMLFAAFGYSTVCSTDDIPVVKGFDAALPVGANCAEGNVNKTLR